VDRLSRGKEDGRTTLSRSEKICGADITLYGDGTEDDGFLRKTCEKKKAIGQKESVGREKIRQKGSRLLLSVVQQGTPKERKQKGGREGEYCRTREKTGPKAVST